MKRHKKLLVIITVVIALLAVPTVVQELIRQPAPQPQPAIAEQKPVEIVPLNADTIYRLVNDERMKAGLQPLLRDVRLDESAQKKADDMVRLNYFDHVSPETGRHGYEYIPSQMCTDAGENIGIADARPDSNIRQMEGWMNSKPHHDAILNPNTTYTGVAVNGIKVVQHFCTAR